jgi:hypothetical protein
MVVAVLIAPLTAQQTPDLSGTWTLASTGVYPPDQRMTITQDAARLTVDSTGYHVRARSNGLRSTWSETPYPVRTTYVLDGAEHPTQRSAEPTVVPTRASSAGAMTSTTEESLSKAVWAGRQLVVMTYERIRVTTPQRTPAEILIRRTVRETLMLAPDGTLVWETLIVPDPFPGSRETPAPTPFRRVFKRS